MATVANGAAATSAANGNLRFNDEAASWDSNPDVHRASEAALRALIAVRPDLEQGRADGTVAAKGLDVLEIGCGTGLLTLRIAPFVRSITAVDAAEGMIAALDTKLASPDASRNVETLATMLTDPEAPGLPAARDGSGRRKYDLILSHLVLHHMDDIPGTLLTMKGCLKPGGELALTDYEDFGPEARRFHPESKMDGVERHGIPAAWMSDALETAGFEQINVKPAWVMRKTVEAFPGEWTNGKPQDKELAEMDFPFLLCRARKPPA